MRVEICAPGASKQNDAGVPTSMIIGFFDALTLRRPFDAGQHIGTESAASGTGSWQHRSKHGENSAAGSETFIAGSDLSVGQRRTMQHKFNDGLVHFLAVRRRLGGKAATM